MEKCSIDRTWLIGYNWVQSRVRVYKLINNEDRCSGITFWVKRRGQLIVRLKAIKFREDAFRYSSSYLHCSFLWNLVIIHLLHHQVLKPNAETSGRIIAPLDRLYPLNHWGFEVSFTSYVTHAMPAGGGRNCDCNRSYYYYLVWELFLLYHLINPSEIQVTQDVISSSWWTTHLHPTIYQDLSA